MTDFVQPEDMTGLAYPPLDDASPAHSVNSTATSSDREAAPGLNPSQKKSFPRGALPELASDLARVAALPEFAGRETSGANVGDDLLLRKIETLSAWMGRHGAHPTRHVKSNTINVRMVLRKIGHPEVDPNKEIRAAIRALATTHGFSATPDARHNPECQIDRDLDKYEELVRTRGKGPPRFVANPTKPCRVGTSRELGCDIRDLDRTCMRRLRMIMASASEPGDIYHPTVEDPSPHRNWKRNPAVPTLLRMGLATYVDGLPADPLDADEIDLITVGTDCGVSMADILPFPDHLALIRAAKGDRPLIQQPMLVARRYTYKDLREEGREARRDEASGNADPGQASRASVSALTIFLKTKHAGGGLDAVVPLDFADRVAKALGDRPKDAGSGWMAEMRRWLEWNDALRASKPLPSSFALACRILCHEAGITAGELACGADSPQTVRNWLRGVNIPSMAQSTTVTAMAEILRVPVRTLNDLLSNEWRVKGFAEDLFELAADDGDVKKRRARRLRQTRHLPLDFTDMTPDERQALLEHNHWAIVNQDSAFARRQAEMSRDEYILKEDRWTPALRDAWDGMIPKPRKSVLRRPGEVIPSTPAIERGGRGKRKDEWRPRTIDHRERLLGSVVGYWTRERKLSEQHLAGFQSRMTDFTPEAGLGIPVELLHPVLFVLPDLMSVFCHWRARRSGAEIATFKNALQLAAEFVRPETGPVWKDPDMLKHLEAFKAWWDANPHDTPEGPITLDIAAFAEPQNWQKAVAGAYEVLREDLYRVLRGKLPKSRDPFITVDVFVSAKNPMELYMKGVRALLASTPHSVIPQHVHIRRCIQALILVQTGLRTGTLLMSVSDQEPGRPQKTASGKEPELFRTLDDDGNVAWQINIPSVRFKNFDSPYFEDERPYVFTLEDEDGLYELLDHYVRKSRIYMLRGRQSDALFVNSTGTDMNEDAMRREYHMITRLYFVRNEQTGAGAVEGAVAHGMHAVRHVIATHIVRVTGDLRLAAYAIQDTLKTAEKHYARFWPKDKVVLAAEVLKRARALGRQAT